MPVMKSCSYCQRYSAAVAHGESCPWCQHPVPVRGNPWTVTKVLVFIALLVALLMEVGR